MKNQLTILLFLCLSTTVFAKKFDIQFVNNSNQPIQLFYQIIEDIEKDEPRFIFDISTIDKNFSIRLKRGQKIKFIGYGSGVETLPVIRDYFDFNKRELNKIQLVLPRVEKLNIIELNEMISKVSNENVLNVLLDTTQYAIDKMPPLGTFIFFNSKRNKSLPLKPTFWKNASDIRTFDNKYYKIIDHVSSSNSASLDLSGIPFLRKLGSSFENSNVLEVIWDIENAHFEQWQPSDKSVYQILADDRNKEFINSCLSEMKLDNLAGGDYKLFFISSSYEADLIKVSAKKYKKIKIDADLDFSQNVDPNLEVVKPLEINADYGFLKEKLYQNIDSTRNASLKILALDYTSALNSHISKIEQQAQKENAENNSKSLKREISNQYLALKNLDSTLINLKEIEAIIPIIEITPNKELLALNFDENGIEITSSDVKNKNTRIMQYNSLLMSSKKKIHIYKETLKSIATLNQPTNYYQIIQSTNPQKLDKKVIESYIETALD